MKKLNIINDNFVSISSKLVFSISLPALIFSETAKVSIAEVINLKEIGFIYIVTIIVFLAVWLFSIPFIKSGSDRAVFIQGSFRGNFAIIGLALISNTFGHEGLSRASILLAFIIPLYNVLSVFALTVPLRKEKNIDFKGLVLEIIKNPLIIAVVVSLPFSFFEIKLPGIVSNVTDYLAALTLPLALIGVGGFLNFQDLKKASGIAFSSSFIKLILVPLIFSFVAYTISFDSTDLGVIFILLACPTAIASFIMAEAMGANGKLAGNIVLITTLGSIITISAGLFILKQNGLI
jgi:malonate transporter and related proteins